MQLPLTRQLAGARQRTDAGAVGRPRVPDLGRFHDPTIVPAPTAWLIAEFARLIKGETERPDKRISATPELHGSLEADLGQRRIAIVASSSSWFRPRRSSAWTRTRSV